MAQKMNIIMFNMSTWHDWQNGVTNRNRHLLETFAEDDLVNQIIAVDFLPFNWKLKLKYWWRNIFLNHDPNQIIYGDGNSLCHQVKSKIFIYSTANTDTGRLKYEINKIIAKLKWEDFAIYSCNPFVGNAKKLFSENNHRFVFDAIDDWATHDSYDKYVQDLFFAYDEIRESADLIFIVSQGLKKLFSRHNHVYFLPNGVDLDFFTKKEYQEITELNLEQKLNLLSINKKKYLTPQIKSIVGYVGVLESRLDVNLLETAINNHPDKLFIFGGETWPKFLRKLRPSSPIVAKLSRHKNVYFNHKYIPYAEAAKWFYAFDVCLIPNKINQFTESMNPMKLYNYLACGKPVVTTRVAGVEDFKSVIYTAEDEKDFSRLIDKAIKEDSGELQKKRVEIVKDYSWQSRVGVILKLLN